MTPYVENPQDAVADGAMGRPPSPGFLEWEQRFELRLTPSSILSRAEFVNAPEIIEDSGAR
jgi:hypothetical protein